MESEFLFALPSCIKDWSETGGLNCRKDSDQIIGIRTGHLWREEKGEKPVHVLWDRNFSGRNVRKAWNVVAVFLLVSVGVDSFAFFRFIPLLDASRDSSSPFSYDNNDSGEERPTIWSPWVLWDQLVEAFRVKRFPDLIEKAAKIYRVKDFICMWEIEWMSLWEKETFVVSCGRERTHEGYLLNPLNEMKILTEILCTTSEMWGSQQRITGSRF